MSHSFAIGAIELSSPIVLAPMAGVTDLPFRLIARRVHRGLNCTEMVSSQSLIHCNRRTASLMLLDPSDRPTSVQLLGRDPSIMAEAAQRIEAAGADIIDINMGCSVRKVQKQGEGSALLKEPELAGEIMRRVRSAVRVPVMVKLRKGFSGDDRRALLIARMAEHEGLDAVAVHGRTIEQEFSGKADWDIVKEIKAHLSIPVIGNGDIRTPEDAVRRLSETCCDGVMIGRATLGNPWLLGAAAAAVEGRDARHGVTVKERFDVIFEHIALCRRIFVEFIAHKLIRKHLAWYVKGLPMSARMRELIFRMDTFEDIERFFRRFLAFMDSYSSIKEGTFIESGAMEALFERLVVQA